MIYVFYYVPIHCTTVSTHTSNYEAWQGASDKGLTNPRSLSIVNIIEAMPLYEKRVFPWENQVPTFLFHLFHCIDKDSLNTFPIHKHKPWEWENGIGNIRSHIKIQILWWVSIGGSDEKTHGVGCYLELEGLKYIGRYRLEGFIVIHLLQLFILMEFSNRWSGERFLRLGLGVFIFHIALWCYVWFAFSFVISSIVLYCHDCVM